MSSLLKSPLHTSIAGGLYNEILSRTSRYYYFLGQTLPWDQISDTPINPIDNFNYELDVRNKIITLKEIKSTDVTFVVPRVNWLTGTIYDMYDDFYSLQLGGINLTDGGTGYLSAPDVIIGVEWTAATVVTAGQQYFYSNRLYTVTVGGTTHASNPPTHTSGSLANGTATFQYVGFPATATATYGAGAVTAITITSYGFGYSVVPAISFDGSNTTDAEATASLAIAHSGATTVETSNIYVITSEFNVYKCLDNNNDSESTVSPVGTSPSPIFLDDGYVWQYLYSIPIALRNKFLTDSYMPVVNALRSQFYSNGSIESVKIVTSGENYTFASITVQGDGYREEDPVYITGIDIDSAGTGYTSATVEIAPPFISDDWADGDIVTLGQKINYNNNIYEVAIPGTLDSPGPTHRYGIVYNGTAALKFIGATVQATATAVAGEVVSIALSGGIQDVTVTNSGSGYTSSPAVTFSGGGGSNAFGFAVMSGTSVSRVVVQNFGDDYTTVPDVVIGTPWASSQTYTIGQQVFAAGRLYTVTVAGTTSSTAPTHLSGSAANGTTTLTYAGAAAKGIAKLRYGAGYSSSPAVNIYEARLTIPTSGVTTSTDTLAYTSHGLAIGDTLTYNNGGGTSATGLTSGNTYYVATASFTSNAFKVKSATTTTTISGVAISGTGGQFTCSATTLAVGDRVTITGTFGGTGSITGYATGNVYKVSAKTGTSPNVTAFTLTTEAGSALTTTAGTPTGLTYKGETIIDITGTGNNAQYFELKGLTAATATAPSTKSEASLIPLVDAGSLVGVIIENGGVGYTYANVTVFGDGSGADVSVDLAPGEVNTIQANSELLAVDGRISSYKVTSGGYGYTTATVTIDGDGTDATATATIVDGAITKINVTNFGSGYRWANVTITGNGKGAKARAIIGVYGGHGKDSVAGLYTKTLMFYSNISDDLNQGFVVDNDFRQIGIIKNPRQFGETYKLSSSIASACYVATGTIDVTKFPADAEITLGSLSGRKFKVVAVTATAVLLQSLDNAVPEIGDVFLNSLSETFTVTGVTSPTVDKYSGELLFIDNKKPFVPTEDQAVTLRTVIQF